MVVLDMRQPRNTKLLFLLLVHTGTATGTVSYVLLHGNLNLIFRIVGN